MTGLDGLQMVRHDGGSPTIAGGKLPVVSGVAAFRVLSQRGLFFSAIPKHHLLWFPASPNGRYECRMGGLVIDHVPPPGSLAITPSGSDSSGDAVGSPEFVLVAVDPGRLALEAAEASAPGAQLSEFLLRYDSALFELAHTLAVESAQEYPNGPMFWDEVASALLARLVKSHTSSPIGIAPHGLLDKTIVGRIREYVTSHLEEAIDIATLAHIAERSPFYFSRIFSRTVGISPHRYIVYLRLKRAIELIRNNQRDLADVALRTGFADQSHLGRWMRRVYGVSLAQLGPGRISKDRRPLGSSRRPADRGI